MTAEGRCLQCGELEGAAVQGLCPQCLLRLGLEQDMSSESMSSWVSTTADASVERLGSLGPYKLLAEIGRGGMGVVYLVEQREPIRRRVALKVVRAEMVSKNVIARFEVERQALALMSHPGIAHIYDGGTMEDGTPYFVMEYVAGIPITEYCDQNRLDTGQRLDLFVRVCDAIHHAHQRGVIHRDIKPSNVLVTIEDGRAMPKVIDFGVAKAVEQRLTERTLFTQRGVLLGTPGYMSPEQAGMTELDVDTTTDIYSLGVLLYEMLVGVLPFDPKRLRDAGWAQMMLIIREEEPSRPSAKVTALAARATDVAQRRRTVPATLCKLLRGDVDWIVMKALEKDRTRRYASASEFAADVRRHLHDEPVNAGPPDLGYRVRKAARRHRLAFAAAGTALAAILAGLVVSAAFYLRAEHMRRERQREVIRLNVAAGMRLADERDEMAALPWLVDALRLEDDERRRPMHRRRIGTTLAHLPLLYRLWPHSAPVEAASWRPDGLAVATASRDGRVTLWNVATGEAMTPPMQHSGGIHALRFSPGGDRLMTAGGDGTARLWDTVVGREMVVLRHAGPVREAVFSPDGLLVATASEDRTAVVWDATDGKQLSTVHHDDKVECAEFSPNGDALLSTSGSKAFISDPRSGRHTLAPLEHDQRNVCASFSRDGSKIVTSSWAGVRLWNTTTGRPLTAPLRHERPVHGVRLSTSARWLLVWCEAATEVPLWNVETGTRLPGPPKGSVPFGSPQFSDDERLILAGDDEGRVHIWRRDTGEPATSVLRHGGAATVAGLDPSGRLLLTYSSDGTARIWDLAPTAATSDLVIRQDEPVIAVSFLVDPGKILTRAGWGRIPDSYARAWDTESGDPITPPLRHGGKVISHSISGDGHLVGTTSVGNGTARVWDLRTGEPITVLQHTRDLSQGRLTRDGKRLIAVAGLRDTHDIRVWDVATGTPLSLPITEERQLAGVEFSADDQHVLTIRPDGEFCVWDTYSGARRSARLKHSGPSEKFANAVSSDGTRVVLPNRDQDFWELWDLPRRKLLASLRGAPIGQEGEQSSRFSPSGELVAVGGTTGVLRVWKSQNAEPVGSPIKQRGAVWRVRFSQDGLLLVSASTDGARVWEAETGEPVTPWLAHGNLVYDADFAPGGERLATASLDRTARVWILKQDERPAEDLVALAELLAGRRIVGTTSSLELKADELWPLWERLRRLYPESFQATPLQVQRWHRAQAEDLCRDERWREAVSHFDAALALATKRWGLLVGRGRARAELRDWDNAVRDYTEALDISPGEIEAAHSVALLHLRRGRQDLVDRTRQDLVSRWAHTRNPDRARWAAETMVLTSLEAEAPRAQAVKWAEIALEIEPDRPERLVLRGAALFRAGRLREADDVLHSALEKGGESPPVSAFAFLALTSRALGRPVQAARWRAVATVAWLKDLRSALAGSRSQTGGLFVSNKKVTWAEREELSALLEEFDGQAEVRPTALH